MYDKFSEFRQLPWLQALLFVRIAYRWLSGPKFLPPTLVRLSSVKTSLSCMNDTADLFSISYSATYIIHRLPGCLTTNISYWIVRIWRYIQWEVARSCPKETIAQQPQRTLYFFVGPDYKDSMIFKHSLRCKVISIVSDNVNYQLQYPLGHSAAPVRWHIRLQGHVIMYL